MTDLKPPRLLIQRDDGNDWTVWQAIESQPTQQAAIEAAKRIAAKAGGTVEWMDGAMGKQGPVSPSKYGLFGPRARA